MEQFLIESVSDAIDIISDRKTECTLDKHDCVHINKNKCTKKLQKIFCDVIDNNPLNPKVGAIYDFPFGIWFRGQSDLSWKITPKVYRKEDSQNEKFFDESSLFYQFQLANPSFAENHVGPFDWLCLMQHYGMPTRLLDWTESILVALFFSVCDPLNSNPYINDDFDGKVIALNARRLNNITRLSSNKNDICIPSSTDTIIRSEMALSRNARDLRINLMKNNVYDTVSNVLEYTSKENFMDWIKGRNISGPVAVFPKRINLRMSPQLSVFTIFGGKVSSKDSGEGDDRFPSKDSGKGDDRLPSPDPLDLSKINNDNDEKIITEFIVPKKCKEAIRTELSRVGIHAGTLFPEIEHQAKRFSELWKNHG